MSQREDGIIQDEKKEESRVKSFHGLFYNFFLSVHFSLETSLYIF